MPKVVKGGRGFILLEEYLHPGSLKGFGQFLFDERGVYMNYGTLTIRIGFSWDGCSGPTKQDSHNLRACLVHDALYRLIAWLMQEGYVTKREEWEYLRKVADDELRKNMREDGASWLRAKYYHLAVRWMGEDALLGNYRKKWKKIVDRVCFAGVCRFK